MFGHCKQMQPISVLVISRERRDLLNRVLDDLKKQDYQGEFEIVVVEETDSPVAPEGVVYVPHPLKNLGIAFARNLSITHAKHDVLVFIDDDCRVQPHWLSTLVAPLVDAQILGTQGGVTVPNGTNSIGWAESLLGFPGGGITRIHEAKGKAQKTKEVSTLNACYRKESVLDAGCFSSAARFGGEDYLLAKRIAAKGVLLFVPDAVVRHEARGSLPAIWTWFVRRGRAEYDVYAEGSVSEDYLPWMLRSSIMLKLLPFLVLLHWSVLPLVLMILFIVGTNLWRFRWVLAEKNIPTMAWCLLPWVRLTMNFATDVGRIKAWKQKR